MYSNPKLAEYKAFLKGKTASVIGVGISNIPLIDFLLENGVTVTARDKKDREKLIANPSRRALYHRRKLSFGYKRTDRFQKSRRALR